jgi:hypothetical protein
MALRVEQSKVRSRGLPYPGFAVAKIKWNFGVERWVEPEKRKRVAGPCLRIRGKSPYLREYAAEMANRKPNKHLHSVDR